MVRYKIQRKIAEYAVHTGKWQDIHSPVRVIRDGEVILEIKTVEKQQVIQSKIEIITDKIKPGEHNENN